MTEQTPEMKRSRLPVVLSVLRLLLLPCIGIIVLQCLAPYQQRFDESVYFNGHWFTALEERFFYNYLILLLVYAILYFLPFFRVSSIAMSLVVFLFGLAEHYVVLFRNMIIYPWDLDSIGLAANVSGTYDFAPTTEVFLALFLFLIMIGLSFVGKDPKLHWFIRTVAVLVVLVAGSFYFQFFVMNRSNQVKSGIGFYYTLVNYNFENGVLLNFCYHLQFLVHAEPEGYNREAVEVNLSSYSPTNESIVPDQVKPDVIMIMSEAFSDLRSISDFPTSEPVMPFYDSLSDDPNCIKKTLITSAFGGNTANSEFEVLTGMSIRFFSPGTYPYKHYIRNDVTSIASLLGDNGYQISAYHPFDLTGWNRNNVMPHLGFPSFVGEDVFDLPKRYRTYISDYSAFSQLISEYETKRAANPDQPIFEYLITIQNHGGYASKETLPFTVAPTLDKDYPQATQYLSLLRMSDEALSMLISYFEEVTRPTVIILYGDHQPNLADGFQDDLKTMASDAGEDPYAPLSRYRTQLMVWANYDISASELASMEEEMISNNYVLPYLTDILGIERTPFLQFEMEMHDAIPVLTENYLITSDGTLFSGGDANLPPEIKNYLTTYEYYQYYVLHNAEENR